jgi:hypothetical protein
MNKQEQSRYSLDIMQRCHSCGGGNVHSSESIVARHLTEHLLVFLTRFAVNIGLLSALVSTIVYSAYPIDHLELPVCDGQPLNKHIEVVKLDQLLQMMTSAIYYGDPAVCVVILFKPNSILITLLGRPPSSSSKVRNGTASFRSLPKEEEQEKNMYE